ncbi:MAG: sn-glycerol-3-phosphate ABC transporter ATP-binding protein UgpC [Clostridia bacterium]
MAKLVFCNVNKVYPNGFHAVHDFNLEVNEGEFIIFVGPSGCGKSTTLRMLAGLENISSGQLLIDGAVANDKSPRQRGVAMVFQSYALYPHLSVYENLAFGLTLQGIDEDVIEEKVLKTAKILGLTEYLERKPRALSGGQRQRVAVGRAIIRKVDIFLMDEPLSNLDAKQRVTMRSEITQIHRKTGATTIYVTHDQTEAMTMADRIVVMKEGRVQQIGTPYDLYFNPINLFVAGFIGEPPMNFIYGTVDKDIIKLENTDQTIDIKSLNKDLTAYCGKRVVVGFRPEIITLTKCEEESIMLHAQVELTELLGDNTNVYVNIGQNKAILKVDPHSNPKSDSKLKFYIPTNGVYLFDAIEEKVID